MAKDTAKIRTLLSAIFFMISVNFTTLNAEQFRYDPHGKRDPFVPLIGQDKTTGVVALAEVVSPDEIRLEGIVGQTNGRKTAFINGELARENSKYGEVEVKKIRKNSVLLTIADKEYTIYLTEEGGAK